MSRLAQRNRVVFVEYPYTLKDLIFAILRKKEAPVKRMLGIRRRLITIKSDVDTSVYNLVMPPVLPVYWIKKQKIFDLALKFNSWIYKITLKKLIKKLEFNEPIIVNAYNPFYGTPLINQLNQSSNIYYCYDGYDTGFYGDKVYDVDHKYTELADAVITTSDYLKEDKLQFNKKSYVVKNGVDYEVFASNVKTDVNKSGDKKVGYIGSLDHRFDIDIVEHAIRQLPEFEFHFTGNLRNLEIKNRLEKYNNVQFFSAIGPNDVPALLASYDVGIIPYTITEYNKNIYPLKINEYLAVGVPVVMTAFADLKDFEGMVSVPNDKESFVEALKKETNLDTPVLIKERCEFAKKNSWDKRTEEFGKILFDSL
ncbi:hypothetical protein FH5T_20870 [Draconibacterium orientale]|nr:hypothetical protein FH5T_20870 [Draconibacterium orientale]